MKKLVVVLGAVILLSVGIWRFHLSAVWYYDSDGSTLWKKTMTLKEKKSIWPYVTKYNVHWNSMSVSVGPGDDMQTVYASRWIDFILWNGHGIKSILVYAMDTKEILYQNGKREMELYDSLGLKMRRGQITTHGGRYIILGIKPPKEEETRLWITVTDELGNVTEDIVDITSIYDPGADKKEEKKRKGRISI